MNETDMANISESQLDEHLERVRRICLAMPEAIEKLSHGSPTFFVKKDKGVFASFAGNHHKDGRVAVWVPAAPGMQSALMKSAPKIYFRPPYVGPSGWIGIELRRIADQDLAGHIAGAWELVLSKIGTSTAKRKEAPTERAGKAAKAPAKATTKSKGRQRQHKSKGK
jgi:hypothetical protein